MRCSLHKTRGGDSPIPHPPSIAPNRRVFIGANSYFSTLTHVSNHQSRTTSQGLQCPHNSHCLQWTIVPSLSSSKLLPETTHSSISASSLTGSIPAHSCFVPLQVHSFLLFPIPPSYLPLCIRSSNSSFRVNALLPQNLQKGAWV